MSDSSHSKALAQLQDYGLEVGDIDLSGVLLRVRHQDDKPGKKDGWYVAHEYFFSDGRSIIVGAYGWWKDGLSYRLKSTTPQGISKEERAELKRQREEVEQKRLQARALVAKEAAERSAKIWEDLPAEGRSEYLIIKKVDALGVRFGRGGSVVVPLRQASGYMTGLQFIPPDGKAKRFITGTEKQGAFHLIGEPAGDVLAIAEGYATAASIHQATAWPVAVAFDKGNLLPVGEELRKAYPKCRLVFCGDDDFKTTGNPGRGAANHAAARLGGLALFPEFESEAGRGTDWNDLWCEAGPKETRRQLLVGVAPKDESSDDNFQHSSSPPRQRFQGVEDQNLDWKWQLLYTTTGNLKACQRNVTLILDNDPRWEGVLWYSEFVYDIEKRKPPPIRHGVKGVWEESDTIATRDWLAQHYGFEPRDDDIVKAALLVAKERPYHPVRRYLERCAEQWDGKPRLEMMAYTYFNADDDNDDGRYHYLRAVMSKWMVAAVARAHAFKSSNKAGLVDFRNILILEGDQRCGKSTALRLLGDPWFSDSHMDMSHKDGQQFVRGVWVIEVPELSSFNKADHNKAKQFLSLAEDRYRNSYGKKVEDWPRQCVIAASTNDEQYLRDPTGNERYWPVRVIGKIDLDGLKRDRHQLWGEAYRLWEESPRCYWVSPEEQRHFASEQEQRYRAPAWEAVIAEWLAEQTKDIAPGMQDEIFFTVAEVLQGAIKMDMPHCNDLTEQKVGTIMRRLKWRSRKRTRGTARINGYIPPVGGYQ